MSIQIKDETAENATMRTAPNPASVTMITDAVSEVLFSVTCAVP